MISSERSGSRLPVGSSARMITGSLTSARAMAMRCCSPPESSIGYAFIRCCRPTHFSTWNVRRCCCDGAMPSTRGTNATLSRTVLLGSSLKSWNTKPSERRYACTWRSESFDRSRPPTTSRPSDGDLLPEQQAQQRRLAGAARPGEEHELSLVDAQRQLAQGVHAAAVHLRDLLGFDHAVSLSGLSSTRRTLSLTRAGFGFPAIAFMT